MSNVKKTKKEIIANTTNHKEDIIGDYVNMYDDAIMKKLYRKEVCLFSVRIEKMLKTKLESIAKEIDDDSITINASKIKKQIFENLEDHDYENVFFPETTKYIISNIFHGYDSMFYVLNKNSEGHILPLEYNNGNFNSTFAKYFPDHIKKWFDMYSKKVVLAIDNTKERSYKVGSTNFLNLFSGYKYNKKDGKDLARIVKGKAGVAFIWKHIEEIWNSGNKQCFEYDQNWIRKLISGHKLVTMLYLKGKMGRGKTCIVNFIKSVLGNHISMTISNDAPFMTEFNGSLIATALCCLDEIVHDFDSFKSLYNKLKPYITDKTMSYRNLYEKLKTLLNMTSFIMLGNYDMLKLDDSAKGDDRRIKVNDVADILKDMIYCDLLDGYIADSDVQYAFYWDCIDNFDPLFNEAKELKLLPMSETKKTMIVQSLDTATSYLKSIVNNYNIMDNDIKPKMLYEHYADYVNNKKDNKKQLMNSTTFLTKLKDCVEYITFTVKRKDGNNPTNYIHIDRRAMVDFFHKKHFWNEFDDILDKLESTNNDEDSDDGDSDNEDIDKIKKCKSDLAVKISLDDQIKHYEKLLNDLRMQKLEELTNQMIPKKVTKVVKKGFDKYVDDLTIRGEGNASITIIDDAIMNADIF